MSNETPVIPNAVTGSLIASGFPFQTTIAAMVRSADNFSIDAEEWPWRDESGNNQFLDLVASRGHVVAPIECKKTQKDTLTFLRPNGSVAHRYRFRSLYLEQMDATKRLEIFCAELGLVPESEGAAFCVVSSSPTGKDQRLLERDAQKLINGSDAYARHLKRR